MERIVNDALLAHLSSTSSFVASQHGFLKRRSTTTCQLAFMHLVTLSIDSGKQTALSYLDIKKAFDGVHHSLLLIKLQQAGILNPLLSCFWSYLSDRTQRVRIGDSLSSPQAVTSGVIQSSNLGPSLFLNFINDISNYIGTSTHFLFADDIKIVYSYHAEQRHFPQCIQNDLNALYEWSTKWKLTFSPEKCKILIHRVAFPTYTFCFITRPFSTLILFGIPFHLTSLNKSLTLYPEYSSCR